MRTWQGWRTFHLLDPHWAPLGATGPTPPHRQPCPHPPPCLHDQPSLHLLHHSQPHHQYHPHHLAVVLGVTVAVGAKQEAGGQKVRGEQRGALHRGVTTMPRCSEVLHWRRRRATRLDYPTSVSGGSG